MKYGLLPILFFIISPEVFSCTGFLKEIGGEVYFAANEDWHDS